MPTFTPAELAEWSGGAWSAEPEVPVSGISHDTRTLKPGEAYIAFRGPSFDGHDFLESAFEKGAALAIVEHELALNRPQLVVPDTHKALQALARGYRETWSGTVVGITGSVGKTTVKEMLASILSQRGTVSKTPGNWNNDIGLPLSMLAAEREAVFGIFELGMNRPGEIDALAGLLQPDWALITAIGKAHTEFFDSLEQIAAEKAGILKHAGAALLDVRSEWFELFKACCAGSIVPFSEEPLNVHVAQPGGYMADNAQLAAALGLELGFSVLEIQAGLDAFHPAPMRWEETLVDGIRFINDAYNANPVSMCAALSTFKALQVEGRKFAVLGGMRELGSLEESEHGTLGELIDQLRFDGVITLGELGKKIACNGILGISKAAAVQLLRETLTPGDAVFLKGSRTERLEEVLSEFKTEVMAAKECG